MILNTKVVFLYLKFTLLGFFVKIVKPAWGPRGSYSQPLRHSFDNWNNVAVFGEKQGSDILSNLTSDEHKQVILLLEETILATDLALYFR